MSDGAPMEDRRDTRPSPVLQALDGATTWIERPVRRVSGSARLNPLPHAGTISVFLFAVVVVSGLYITLFFEYGHAASYRSVASMESHAIQKVVRALHRYASAALVVTTVVHGWRILVAGRFVGRQRRLRWTTGTAAVLLVWSAGVTGYWLVWDVRAQALNEVVIGFVGGTGAGAGFAIGHLGLVGDGSGSGFLLVLWLLHLGLSATIGFFLYRHLRRSKLPWLPPRHLMAVMGAGLVLVSLAAPVGMLAPADPQRLIGEIPVDPFVLFLLPPLLSDGRWVAAGISLVLLALVLVLPRLLRRGDPEIVTIDEQACTGCELCVVDCPYEALTMDDSTGRALAVVDQQRCVACGICLGSCAFGAIDLPGTAPLSPVAVEGRTVVVACDRHLGDEDLTSSDNTVVQAVGCAGAIPPDGLKAFVDRGAVAINVVGCAPNECRYGIGNTLAAARLDGRRRPHPATRHTRIATQDWVPSDRFAEAVRRPGNHPSADADKPPKRREALVGVAAITALSVAGIAAATRAPFDPGATGGSLRLVVDHQAGSPLRLDPEAGPVGQMASLDVSVDDRAVGTVVNGGDEGSWVEIVDLDLDLPADESDGSGSTRLRVEAVTEAGVRTLLTDAPARTAAGTRLVVDLTDVPAPPTVADGRRIFSSRTGGCDVCHSVTAGDNGVGPSLAGVASLAGDRVEGLTAEQYLRQSILLPDQYVVPGWPAGQMLPIYRDRLSEEELDAVIGYLMTLDNPPTEGDS